MQTDFHNHAIIASTVSWKQLEVAYRRTVNTTPILTYIKRFAPTNVRVQRIDTCGLAISFIDNCPSSKHEESNCLREEVIFEKKYS
jgi:hypothetical protein